MTTDHATFRRVFKAAGVLGIADRVLIAGGAVVDIKTATDIDVFVLEDFHSGGHDSALLLRHLDSDWVVDRDPIEYLAADDRQVKDHACCSIGTAHPSARGKPIHVVASESRDWQGVLNSFDLSICRWGVHHDGLLLRGIGATTRTQPIRVLRMTYTTPERAVKYQQRFKVPCLPIST